jgi:hypothetical protein
MRRTIARVVIYYSDYILSVWVGIANQLFELTSQKTIIFDRFRRNEKLKYFVFLNAPVKIKNKK